MLKFRRTRHATNESSASGKEAESASKAPKHSSLSGRMKKSAPPPPPQQSGASVIPHKVAVIAHNPDDSAINELLEGRMELEVVLPGNKTVKMTVERRVPMMDLLVQVTSANKISPGGHVIHVMTERGNDVIHYKPSTPIGSLDTNTIHVVPKNSVIVPPVKKLPKVINQPFEQTFRLQVNLPRNQLAVLRVSPKLTLADIHRMTCDDKALDHTKYDLRHPNHLDEPLDQNLRLSQYGMNEISLVSSYRSSNGSIHGSTNDILALRTKDEKKKKGLFGISWKRRSKFSLDSQGEDPNSRGVSPTRSDSSGGGGYTSSDARSTSPNRPITYHDGMSVTAKPNRPTSHSKKRPAPPPPPLPSTSQQSSTPPTQTNSETAEDTSPEKTPEKQTMPIVSHSRHSSDSSGYHEASVLSDALDSMPTTQSSSPTTSLETSPSEPPCQNHVDKPSTAPSILSRPKSMSCSNVSVASMKKRRAPAPPPPPSAKTLEDFPPELDTAVEQIEQCSRLNQNGDSQRTPEEDYREFVFSKSTSALRTDYSSQDTIGDGVAIQTNTLREKSEDLTEIEVSIDKSDDLVTASTNTKLERNLKQHRLVRQSTVNIPITEDHHEWQELEAAYSSEMKDTVSKITSKMPPEKPKRRLSSRHSFANHTHKSVDGDYARVRTSSLSSQDTLNDIEASFEQTIVIAENMISREESHETSVSSDVTAITESEEPETCTRPNEEYKPEEKKIFQEKRTEDAPTSEVTEPERTFFAAVEEISNTSIEQSKSRSESESETSISSSSVITAPEPHQPLTEPPKSSPNKSNQPPDEFVKSDYSSSSESSVDSQIHVPIAPPSPPPPQQETVQEVRSEKHVSSTCEVQVSSTISNFQIQPYVAQTTPRSIRAEIEAEINEGSDGPKVLSSHFSSMQDLHKSSLSGEELSSSSSKLQDDVETTMRKVHSEVNLMVSQRNPGGSNVKEQDEMQTQYKKLQDQFLRWQKKLADNQSILDAEHKALVDQSSVTIDVSESTLNEKAETLPRVSKKQESPAKPRPIRHKPSVVIGSWSDQKSSLHKEYKTEIKIRSDEIEEQKKEEARVAKLESAKPSFRISHSKIDTDIFSSPKDQPKPPVRSPVRSPVRGPAVPAKPLTKRAFSEEAPSLSQQPNFERRPIQKTLSTTSPPRMEKPKSPYSFSTWSKLEINDNQPLIVFKKRGVTTNNKGELVVKESRVESSALDVQIRAIQEAKNKVMEQVKNKVKERSESEDSSDSVVSQNDSINFSPKTTAKGPLVESNIVFKSPEIVTAPPRRSESKKELANGQIVSNGSVYIENIKNLSNQGGEKENVCRDNIPLPPPPPPVAPVPNLQKNKNVNILNGSPPIIVNRNKPRKIIEPKLDAREELMLAIRNFGGRTALRQV